MMSGPDKTSMKRSERTCAGCGRADDASALLRLVVGPDGEVVVDVAGGAFGRGAHVHAARECIEKACKSGLARSFKGKLQADPDELGRDVEAAYDRRIQGLVLGARRAGHLAIGQDAALEAVRDGAPLLVVACDAGSVVTRELVRKAIADGRAVVWKNKTVLGGLFGVSEVAIFAVAHEKIAAEIREARSRSEACSRRREVR
jgi:predicted RNA-binding protein YlxR (DUF448 family)